MPILEIDIHRPNFYLFPTNNNRTAWRPFGLPVIMVVPHRRDPLGGVIQNSSVFNVKVYIENVPRFAFVAGHDHIGLKYPDRELYSKTLNALELAEKQIDLTNVTIYRDDTIISFKDAKTGDLIEYTTASGVIDKITYVDGADYYDLSEVLIDTELLPSDNYNLVYESQYFTRVLSKDEKNQFLCIDINSISLALLRFAIQHPGQIIDEFYRSTPAPNLTNASKSKDTTVALYRPFTDVLQDIADEQNILERINWVFDAPAETIPYLSSLLGWDLPFFPRSLDQLRRAVLRRTVEFQNLKGSRRSIINIFRLFGFEVLITNLWWSSDGKRLIRPGEKLPFSYENEEITINPRYQIDIGLSDQIVNTFGEYSIPLLYRPQIEAGLDNFTALQDGGNITIDAYNVTYGSEAWNELNAIVTDIKNNPSEYGASANCVIDTSGFINPTKIHQSINGLEINGYSQVLISGKLGDATNDINVGIKPPLTKRGIKMNRETNILQLTLNGYFDPKDNERIFVFITYNKLDIIVPSILSTLQSNRFDLQVLTQTLDEFADPTTLEFAMEFLYRLKAFHSLLNVIRTRIDLTETYQTTDICIGGDFEQRYDIDIGRLQVPPAIIPKIPGDITDCTQLDPESLGYKESDIIYRLRQLTNLPEEHEIWRNYDNRYEDIANELMRILEQMPGSGRDKCLFTYYGQDRISTTQRIESKSSEYGPSPNANQNISGYTTNNILSPVDIIIKGDYNANGPQSSSNNNSHQYGLFTKEFTNIRDAFCDLDGVNDYCYKGRVDDEILYRPTIINNDFIKSHPCSLKLGHGVYWAYPTISKIARPGTKSPCRKSKTQIIRFTGQSPSSSIEYYKDNLQNEYLTQPYDKKLSSKCDSFLGRLYRDYNTPTSETIHYTNRITSDLDQRFQLALQRPTLDIQKTTLHLPGCRFPRLNALEVDFEHQIWRARPWDDLHSTFCGPKNICAGKEPKFLNFTMVKDTDGNETLVFDDEPFKVLGNGLVPDIFSLGDHELKSNSLFEENDVIHAIYMKSANDNPAIVFDQVLPYDENVDDNGLIQTTDPLFMSHNQCGTAYLDYADGYPCKFGYQPYAGDDIGRSGLYDSIFEGLGLNTNTMSVTSTTYLFTLGSGIKNESGIRLDCGCLLVNCDDSLNQIGQSICSSSIFLDEDNNYEWDTDHLRIMSNMVLDEDIGSCMIQLDGTIPTFLEIL